MKRVLAVLAALGMVTASLAVRARLDDDGDGSSTVGGGGRLVCAPELADACRELDADVVVEDGAVTADRLVDADRPDFDAWAVAGPWPGIVDALREPAGREPLFSRASERLASSPLVVVGPTGLDGVGWRDLGEQVGAGDLRLGWPAPDAGLGLLAVGAFTVGWFDRTDVASNDLDNDPGFRPYLDAIVDEARVERSPVLTRLQTGRAQIEAAVSYEADATTLLEDAAPGRRAGLELLYPDPVATVEAQLAGGTDVAGELREALLSEGWDAELPRASGLPRPGVLAALWDRVRR